MCQQLSSLGPHPNHANKQSNKNLRGHTRSTRHLYKSYQKELSRTRMAGGVCTQSTQYVVTCPHAPGAGLLGSPPHRNADPCEAPCTCSPPSFCTKNLLLSVPGSSYQVAP